MSQGRNTNIPYTTDAPDDPFRQFDIYYPSQNGINPPSLICFIHGGAWISGDKAQHALSASNLLAATGYPVAVPNYRLTPPSNTDPAYAHPMHLVDLISFLEFILTWDNPPCSYNPSRIVLIGHSCSAHMISSLFFHPNDDDNGAPWRMTTSHILDSTRAIVLSEGIYDLGSLLRSFPKYREWFVEPAFGPGPYDSLSILNSTLRHGATDIPWLLIHSEGDTLVDVYQTTDMHIHLKNLHAGVTISLFDVVDEHDAVLESDKYINIVKDFLVPRRSSS